MKTIIIGLLVLTSLTTSAFADHRAYLAASCQDDLSGEGGAFRRNETEMKRLSDAGTGRIVCPIIRNVVSGLARKTEPRVRISVTDNNPVGDIICSVSVRKIDGQPLGWKTRSTSGASAKFTLLFFPETETDSSNPMSIECVLPGPGELGHYAAIHNYHVSD